MALAGWYRLWPLFSLREALSLAALCSAVAGALLWSLAASRSYTQRREPVVAFLRLAAFWIPACGVYERAVMAGGLPWDGWGTGWRGQAIFCLLLLVSCQSIGELPGEEIIVCMRRGTMQRVMPGWLPSSLTPSKFHPFPPLPRPPICPTGLAQHNFAWRVRLWLHVPLQAAMAAGLVWRAKQFCGCAALQHQQSEAMLHRLRGALDALAAGTTDPVLAATLPGVAALVGPVTPGGECWAMVVVVASFMGLVIPTLVVGAWELGEFRLFRWGQGRRYRPCLLTALYSRLPRRSKRLQRCVEAVDLGLAALVALGGCWDAARVLAARREAAAM